MAQKKPVVLGISLADAIVFFAYVTMLCIFVPLHEPWTDEAQAWLLSRDLSIPSLLVRSLRYEGHPALWYLVLWIPAHLHVSYSLLNWFSAAIAAGGIYVFLRFAPFPFYLRALLPFTFFLGYQYSIVARNYVLYPLLAFLGAHVYRLKRPRPVWMAAILALLANVSLHGTIVAMTFAGLYLRKLKRQREEPGAPSPREIRVAGLLFSGSILFVALCLWPPRGAIRLIHPSVDKIVSRLSFPISESDSAPAAVHAAPEAPTPPPRPTVGTADAKSPAGSSRLVTAAKVLSYAFASSWVSAIAFEGLVLVYLFRRRQAMLALPAALLALFLIGVYAAPWHFGLLWVTCLMILWAAWDESVPATAIDLQNVVAVFLGLLCVFQLPWTFHALAYDARYPTSSDKAAAAYLHSLPSNTRMAGFGMSVGVQPYFDRNIFFNQAETFTLWDGEPPLMSLDEAMAGRPDVVVADPYLAPRVEAAGYAVTHEFCGAMYLPNLYVRPGCTSILERISPPAKQPDSATGGGQ